MPVLASTRIAERAVTDGAPSRGGTGALSSVIVGGFRACRARGLAGGAGRAAAAAGAAWFRKCRDAAKAPAARQAASTSNTRDGHRRLRRRRVTGVSTE